MNFNIPTVLSITVILFCLMQRIESRPGLGALPYYHGLHHHFPSAASQQTTVVRDFLGNQGTSYAYQNHNGISASAVAVSRSDNSKTLAYLPALLGGHHHGIGYAHHHQHHHYDPALAIASPAAVYNNYVGVV